MKKVLQLSVFLGFIVILLACTGLQLNYHTASAYDKVASPLAFTPTGYASLNAGIASASAVLGSSGSSSPIATTAVIQNLGSVTAYVLLGASNVVVTTGTGYPVQPSQTVTLTVRNSGYFAAITGSSTAVVHVTTGY